MTIAIKIELKEDWGHNQPCVEVMARPVTRTSARLGYTPKEEGEDDRTVARLTPESPAASVCITKDQDLYFRVEHGTADKLGKPR